MIELVLAAVCFSLFVAFELFAQSLERLSPIKLRSLLEEEPRKLRLFSSREEIPAVKIALRVVIQILLLVGFWTLIRSLAAFAVPSPWIWGAVLFLV